MKKTYLLAIPVIALMFFTCSENIMAATISDTAEEIVALTNRTDSLEKTYSINRKDLEIIEMSDVDLKGKKITFLGDSVTEGLGGTKDENGNYISYTDYVSEITGAESINLGIGGTSIGDYWDENSFILRYTAIPSDSDIIVLFGGVNDFFIGPDMGETDIPQTYRGDTYSLFSGIHNNYPDAEVFVVTTYKNGAESWFPDHDLEEYMNVQLEFAEEFGFHVIDLFHTGFMNCRDESVSSVLVPDGIHPNDEGNQVLAERISSILLQEY